MIDDDLQLEARIRESLDRRPVPDRPLRGVRTSMMPRPLLVFAVVALALTAIGVGQLLATYRTVVAASTPNPQLSPLASIINRDGAIAVVQRLEMVGRVDRIDSKLMTFDEYVRVAGPVRTRLGDPSATPITGFGIRDDPTMRNVWVVAVAGEVWPSGRIPVSFGGPSVVSPTPFPPYRWAIFLVDAATGQFLVVGDAGADTSWPQAYGAMASHPVGPP